MTPYPTELPTDAINLIVADIRNGTVGSDRAAFAKAVWELQGFGLKSTFGDPSPVHAMAAGPVEDLTNEQVADHLERLLTPAFAFTGSGTLSTIAAVVAALPWRAILKWALTTAAATL